ncbi:autotransporter outer membrane beta-barrel domain-containing protein [Erythrobacter sp. KY5]|uniref:outer membrane beta-barrel protein n=1 Tax=Erythrobacter sp. KY5 TaxID=2011159 RepID=UPI000DBF0B66|nr:outer membrane beta-barrel protein [Erythrobacter sp. KY5]AWW75085.1 autotransporter outer membrane beta-barrel domain-containing protein [Erythrobacter sp. KY5]
MKTKTILLSAASVALLSTPAFAQDADDNFTGFRLEGVGGYDTSRAGSSVDDDANQDNDQSIDGLVYGAAVGYDFNAGGVVLGVEAELTDSTADTEFADGDFEGFGLGNVETGRDIYLGARIGTTIGDTTLLYAKGGYTNARYNIKGSFDGEDYNSSIDTDGYRVGAGIEQMIGNNAYAKLEYRYSNYSEAELDFEDGDIPDVDLGEIDTDRHQVMAGVGWRF